MTLSKEKSGTRAGRKPCSEGATLVSMGCGVAGDADADERQFGHRLISSRSVLVSRAQPLSAPPPPFRSKTKRTTGANAASSETSRTSAAEAIFLLSEFCPRFFFFAPLFNFAKSRRRENRRRLSFQNLIYLHPPPSLSSLPDKKNQ